MVLLFLHPGEKNIWSGWYWPMEFTTLVLYLLASTSTTKITIKRNPLSAETTNTKSICFMTLEEKDDFEGFILQMAGGSHWNELWHIHSYINIAKCRRQDICIPLSDSLGQETSFTLRIHSSFQMIQLNVWLIFIQLLYLEHLKDPWAIYFFRDC